MESKRLNKAQFEMTRPITASNFSKQPQNHYDHFRVQSATINVQGNQINSNAADSIQNTKREQLKTQNEYQNDFFMKQNSVIKIKGADTKNPFEFQRERTVDSFNIVNDEASRNSFENSRLSPFNILPKTVHNNNSNNEYASIPNELKTNDDEEANSFEQSFVDSSNNFDNPKLRPKTTDVAITNKKKKHNEAGPI